MHCLCKVFFSDFISKKQHWPPSRIKSEKRRPLKHPVIFSSTSIKGQKLCFYDIIISFLVNFILELSIILVYVLHFIDLYFGILEENSFIIES